MMPIIRSAKARPDSEVEIEWDEGGISIISFHETIAKGGVFAPLADPEFFGKVTVADEGHCITWPGELDFGADALWYRAHPDATIEELDVFQDPAPPNSEGPDRRR
jgi:hypothetical protein